MIGFGGLLWIIEILTNKYYNNQEKLEHIHTRTIIHTYLFLFTARIILLCAILGPSLCWGILIWFLGVNMINGIDRFDRRLMKWIIEDKQTLYDLKQKYYAKRKN